MGAAAVPAGLGMFRQSADQNNTYCIFVSNPYILNIKTNIKTVTPHQGCGNSNFVLKIHVTRILRWTYGLCRYIYVKYSCVYTHTHTHTYTL